MTTELTLLKATIDAWAINAKREKEAAKTSDGKNDLWLHDHWSAQEIALQRVQALLEKAGVA